MDQPRPRYQITLEALPDPNGVPAPRRLHRALKKLLREFRLVCKDAREVDAPAPLTLADLEPLENPVEIR